MSEVRHILGDELLKVERTTPALEAPSPPVPPQTTQVIDEFFTQEGKDEENSAALLLAWQMLPAIHERHGKAQADEEPEKTRKNGEKAGA